MKPSIYRTIKMITARAISKVALRIIENKKIDTDISSMISIFDTDVLDSSKLTYNQFVILNGNHLINAMSEPQSQKELYESVSHVSKTLLMALKVGNNEFMNTLIDSYTNNIITMTSNIHKSCSMIMNYYQITINNFFGVVHTINTTLEQIIGLFYDCIQETIEHDPVLQNLQAILELSNKWI